MAFNEGWAPSTYTVTTTGKITGGNSDYWVYDPNQDQYVRRMNVHPNSLLRKYPHAKMRAAFFLAVHDHGAELVQWRGKRRIEQDFSHWVLAEVQEPTWDASSTYEIRVLQVMDKEE